MIVRSAVAACAAVVACVAATACAPPGGTGHSGSADTIKIGVLRPATGSVAANGQDMERGWNLYWDTNGTTVAGKHVQTQLEDDAGNPSIGLNKANQLVDSARVNIIVGPLLANVGLAVADAMDRKNIPMVMPVVSADDLTQRKPPKNMVRLAGWTSSQTTHPLGEYAADKGYKTAVTICNDYAFGYESCGGFVNTFTDRGGRILRQLWNPLGTQDFSTYLAQIRDARPDVVFTEEVGVDSVRFVSTWNDFGLRGSGIALLGNETLTDQAVLRSMGSGANGIITVGHFTEGRDDPDTSSMVNAYYTKYHDYPSYYATAMYTAARGIAEAIAAVNGNVSDIGKLLTALRAVSLAHTPFGPEKLDGYGNPVFTVYVRQVQQGPHGAWNIPLRTYDQVSQFWHYDTQQFLKHPVYSKTYQGNGVWPNPQS
jgi:branched-chain amino acid transport system substrate-binding protein